MHCVKGTLRLGMMVWDEKRPLATYRSLRHIQFGLQQVARHGLIHEGRYKGGGMAVCLPSPNAHGILLSAFLAVLWIVGDVEKRPFPTPPHIQKQLTNSSTYSDFLWIKKR